MSLTRFSGVIRGEKVKTFSAGFRHGWARLVAALSAGFHQPERAFGHICPLAVAQVTKWAEVSGLKAYNSFTMNDIAKKYMCPQHPPTGQGSKGIYLFLPPDNVHSALSSFDGRSKERMSEGSFLFLGENDKGSAVPMQRPVFRRSISLRNACPHGFTRQTGFSPEMQQVEPIDIETNRP